MRIYAYKKMRIKDYILVVLLLSLLVKPVLVKAQADSEQSREYQVKAAFLYNFIKFVDWPKETMPDGNESVIIGIIGKDPFGKLFVAIKDKLVKGKKVVIKRFKGLEELQESGEEDKSLMHP